MKPWQLSMVNWSWKRYRITAGRPAAVNGAHCGSDFYQDQLCLIVRSGVCKLQPWVYT
jgi:hypothetical protein